jgi:hypothetical protein
MNKEMVATQLKALSERRMEIRKAILELKADIKEKKNF